MARPKSEAHTRLYRHYGAGGVLLYVGVSLSAVIRLYQHRTSSWIHDVVRVDIQTYPTRAAALAAECEAIKCEKPMHNKTHSSKTLVLTQQQVGIGRMAHRLALVAKREGRDDDAAYWNDVADRSLAGETGVI